MKKAISETIVKETAKRLIDENGETTTLDVKQDLRSQGYWAKQADVSDHMMNLGSQGDFEWDDNGQYRTYYERPVALPSPITWTATPTQATVINAQVPKLTKDDAEILDNPEDRCWIVFTYSDPNTTIYVSGNVGRNVAREVGKNHFSETYTNIGASVYRE